METQTKRPTRYDDDVISEAAAALAVKVKQWCGDSDTDLNIQDIIEDLKSAIHISDDGYGIAKRLDGTYNPDAALVEILDEAYGYKRNALNKREIAWVQANKLQPIPIETKVKWPKGPAATANLIGIVTANHLDGKATVAFMELGHVREGMGSHGYIVEWEVLEVQPA